MIFISTQTFMPVSDLHLDVLLLISINFSINRILTGNQKNYQVVDAVNRFWKQPNMCFQGTKNIVRVKEIFELWRVCCKIHEKNENVCVCVCVCVCGILIVKSQINPLKDASRDPITPLTIGILKSISYYNMQICHQEIIKAVIF